MAEGQKPPVDMAAVISDGIELDHRLYEETGNPMWAWFALASVLDDDLPLPEWLRDYLELSALRLLRSAGESSPAAPDRVLVSLAFRRRRGTDDLSEFYSEMVKLKRGVRMLKFNLRGKSAKYASEELEKAEKVDARRLREAWKRFQQLVDMIGDDQDAK
jgi:hypothetical protein